MMKKVLIIILLSFSLLPVQASYLLLPMDDAQKDHLKCYGIAFWVLENGSKLDWMLNYRGGSFCFAYSDLLEKECLIRNVSYEIIPDASYNKIVSDIGDPEVNMDVMNWKKLRK